MSKELEICFGKLKSNEAFEIEWIFCDLPFRFNRLTHRSPVFTFSEYTWALELFTELHWTNDLDVYVGLVKVSGTCEWREKFKCKLELKNVDGTVSHFLPCSTERFGVNSIAANQRLSLLCENLSSPNKFIIVCTLSKDPDHFSQLSASHELAPLKLQSRFNYSLNAYLALVQVGGTCEWREKFNCKFGLKIVDGTESHFFSCSALRFGIDSIAAKQRLQFGLDNLSSRYKFIITCTMMKDSNHNAELSASHELAPLKLMNLDTLSENFKSLFADKDSCDLILRVKDKEFKAHKAVLMARSTVFSAMFHHDTSEKQTSIVPITDCDPDSFHQFLEYLYSGKLDDFSFQNIFHLYSTSDKYNAQELKAFCAKYMEQNLNEDNACDVIILADLYDDAALFSASQDFFNKNSIKIVETIHWENLMKNNFRLANKVIKSTLRDSHSSK